MQRRLHLLLRQLLTMQATGLFLALFPLLSNECLHDPVKAEAALLAQSHRHLHQYFWGLLVCQLGELGVLFSLFCFETEVSLCSPDLERATKTKLASSPQRPDNLCLPTTGITTLTILCPPMLRYLLR